MCPELEENLAQVQPTLHQTGLQRADRVDEGWKLRSYRPRWLRQPLSQAPQDPDKVQVLRGYG